MRKAILIMTVMLAMLSGCTDDSDKPKTLTLTLKNRTEYEFHKILFTRSNTSGQGQPYMFHNIVNTEAEYRENYFYNSEEGAFYSGYDAESIEPFAAGDEIQFKIDIGTKRLSDGVSVELETSKAKYRSDFDLSEEIQGLIIVYEAETGFVFLPFYQNDERVEIKYIETAAQYIETKGGKPHYVYIGEGEIGDCKAWYFNLVGDADEYRFAVNERGELWGMDTLGKWQFLP